MLIKFVIVLAIVSPPMQSQGIRPTMLVNQTVQLQETNATMLLNQTVQSQVTNATMPMNQTVQLQETNATIAMNQTTEPQTYIIVQSCTTDFACIRSSIYAYAVAFVQGIILTVLLILLILMIAIIIKENALNKKLKDLGRS